MWELAPPLELPELAVHAEEDLLGDVVGVARATREVQGEGEDPWPVSADDLLEGPRVSPLRALRTSACIAAEDARRASSLSRSSAVCKVNAISAAFYRNEKMMSCSWLPRLDGKSGIQFVNLSRQAQVPQRFVPLESRFVVPPSRVTLPTGLELAAVLLHQASPVLVALDDGAILATLNVMGGSRHTPEWAITPDGKVYVAFGSRWNSDL